MLRFYSTSRNEGEQISSNDEHTASNPYCSDIRCWCHTDVAYHAEVTGLRETTDEAEYKAVLSFLGLWSV